jgi:uncharacterized protein
VSAILLTLLLGGASAGASIGVLAAGDVPAGDFLQPVPWTKVKLADSFFRPLQERIRDVTHAHCRKKLEQAHALDLIDRAAKNEGKPEWKTPVWSDSDLFKLVESMAYTLGTDPSPARDAEFDALVARIAAAQRPDGYLDSWFEVYAPQERFKNLKDCHELYCAGHLIEAAVAHHQATGKRNLLDVALKYADLIDRRFRTDADALQGYCGHPEIELALVRLADETRERRWLDLAATFIDRRGSHYFAREHGTPDDQYEGEYFQDHRPLVQQTKMVGHAVRAGYLWTGATEVAARRGDEALLDAVDSVWRNTANRRMFVTGGIGALASNEGFTTDFDLPTATAYQETCASIAFALLNERLGRLEHDGAYHDLFERALLNAILAGFSDDGCHFFYANPLASHGGTTRPEWYDCACCPNNVTRTLAGLGRFVASTSEGGLWIHLPIAGTVDAVVDGKPVRLTITGDYPWPGRGTITLSLKEPARFALQLRRPEWADGFVAKVDGESDAVRDAAEEAEMLAEAEHFAAGEELPAGYERASGYESLIREWRDGASIDFELDASIRRLVADPRAEGLRGQVALQYGPFIDCIEQCDYPEPIENLYLPETAPLAVRDVGPYRVITGLIRSAKPESWPGGLYAPAPASHELSFRAIPYYAWDERRPGAMRVWLPTAPSPPPVRGLEEEAKVGVSFQADGASPAAVADPIDPKSSKEHPPGLCHFFPHRGGREWIEYAFDEPTRVTSSRVYWFDDTGSGQCRLPKSARLLWKEGDAWKPVGGDLGVAGDRWCEVEFPAVTTKALRLEIEQQEKFASGVLAWNVFDDRRE